MPVSYTIISALFLLPHQSPTTRSDLIPHITHSKMLAKFAILITALAASSVLAAPALERRQTGYITLCSEKMMLDGCQDLGIQTGQCRE